MQEFLVEEKDVSKRLDVLLEEKLNVSRSKVKKSVDEQLVKVNSKPQKAGYKVKLNDRIECTLVDIPMLNANPENIPLDIVFENENVIVINKPSGMVVHPASGNFSGTLVNALCYYTHNLSSVGGEFRPGIVHRLDKDTSGLLLIAKNDLAHQSLASQIKTKTCKRFYQAVLEGNLKADSGIVETNLARSVKDRKKIEVCESTKGKKAITYYKVLERFKGYCLVEFELKTGRTHQIRVHAKYLGHPVVGDMTYGFKTHKELNGQLLHAYKIEFFEPVTNEKISLSCPLPEKFNMFLNKLKNSWYFFKIMLALIQGVNYAKRN